MKSRRITSIVFGIVISIPCFAQRVPLAAQGELILAGDAQDQQQTPAQQRILAATQQIAKDPKRVEAYNALTLAYIRRARETADPKYLKEAEASLAQGLKLEPTDFQLQKAQVALLLSSQQYAQAKEQATALHHGTPDDVMTYGYLAEACIGLGDYANAETNAQWMMNMRPNNTPALLVGAKLRVLFGDAHGAIDFLNRALAQTSPVEVEDQAWIANQIASIQIDSGQNDSAEQTLQRAEGLFPHYPYTVESLGRIRMAQNRPVDAIQLWTRARSLDPNPHIVYELAESQEAAGLTEQAHATYAEFQKLTTAPESATDEAKVDLVLMLAAKASTAPDALKLAEQLIKSREDVWTLDAYAWALYANGNFKDAEAAVSKAIAVGVQDARIFDHAGHIAQKLDQTEDTAKFLRLAVQSNPSSSFAADAMKFAGVTLPAEEHNRKVSQVAPPPTPPQTAPQSSLAASVRPRPSVLPSTAAGPKAAPTFAPVPDSLLTPQPTGTDRLIRNAQTTVSLNPKDAQAYAALGAAYFQRARETGDVGDYQLSEESLTKSLDLVSVDFSADAALGSMAEVCMGEHRFDDALMYAQKALSLGTGDISSFAIVGDAYADMGEYDKAEVAYGRLTPRDMTLAPRAAYARDSRLSYLKFVAGDTPGAVALMKLAITEGVEAQLPSENLAWLYYELGEYETQSGDPASADSAYVAALSTHPGDYRALAALARLRANNGRYEEAIVLYQKAIAVVPMPIFIAELGDLYAKQGNQVEARKQYALVEYIGLLGHINQVLHNRDLALFYADHDMKLAEALELAQKELEVRRDVYTWDSLAWALYKNGKLAEAAKASEKAMQFGTRDSILLFHAGMIAQAQGMTETARTELKEALAINPRFNLLYADEARAKLNALEPQLAQKGGSNEDAR